MIRASLATLLLALACGCTQSPDVAQTSDSSNTTTPAAPGAADGKLVSVKVPGMT